MFIDDLFIVTFRNDLLDPLVSIFNPSGLRLTRTLSSPRSATSTFWIANPNNNLMNCAAAGSEVSPQVELALFTMEPGHVNDPRTLVSDVRTARQQILSSSGNRLLVHLPPRAHRPLGGALHPRSHRAHADGPVHQQPGPFQLQGESGGGGAGGAEPGENMTSAQLLVCFKKENPQCL